jgi:hypothetical protein
MLRRFDRATRRQAHGADGADSVIRQFIGRRWFSLLCLVLIIWLICAQSWMGWYPIWRWDWLQHTGVMVFLVALYFARQVPTQFLEVLSRLPLADPADGNEVSVESAERVATQIRVSARRYSRIGLAVGLIGMTVHWISAYEHAWNNPLFFVELALAIVAGYVVGGFVAYARIGRLLEAWPPSRSTTRTS